MQREDISDDVRCEAYLLGQSRSNTGRVDEQNPADDMLGVNYMSRYKDKG